MRRGDWTTPLLIGFALSILPQPPAHADTILVPQDYPTIQQAIDAASNGDEIVVAPGNYNESIDTLRKEIHLRSSDGPEVTTIGADPRSSAIMCLSSPHDDIIIEGFRVTGGEGYFVNKFDSEGGGMYINASHPTVINCIFTRNSATFGGGVALVRADPTFIDCLFFDNLAAEAGGMSNGSGSSPTLINCTFQENSANGDWGDLGGAMAYGSPTIAGCSFIDNYATDDGGAIAYANAVITKSLFQGNFAEEHAGGALYGVSGMIRDCVFRDHETSIGGAIATTLDDLEIVNTKFIGNHARSSGGALRSEASIVTISNCTFSGNSSQRGAAAIVGVMDDRRSNQITIANCIFRDGGDEIANFDDPPIVVTYSNVEGGYLGEGNIDADPRFVNVDAGDYRLSGLSPCIDAGDNDAVAPDTFDLDEDDDTREPIPFDISGAPRFVDDPATEDTGRCEFRCELPIVDMGAYEFQPTGGCVRDPAWQCDGDVDGDGQVNPVDAGLVQAAFGSTDEGDLCQYDMDCDEQINPVDSGIVQALFGTCQAPRNVCP